MITKDEDQRMVQTKIVKIEDRISIHGENCCIVRFESGDKMFCSERAPWTILNLWHFAEARIIVPKDKFELDMNDLIGKEYIFDRKMRCVYPIPEVEDLIDLYKEIDQRFLDIQSDEDECYGPADN